MNFKNYSKIIPEMIFNAIIGGGSAAALLFLLLL